MNKQPLNITAADYPISVFRVGNTPKLLSTTDRIVTQQQITQNIHSHFTYEVFFIVSGTLELVTEHFTLPYQNKILIIPPKFKHCCLFGEAECYCLLFSFKEDSDRTSAIKRQLDEEIKTLEMSDSAAFYIRRFTEMLLQNSPDGEAAAQHLAALLFSEVLLPFRQEVHSFDKKAQNKSRHISTVEEFINLNLHRKFSLSDVSAAVFLSTRQISRIIEQEYGCSFSELVMNKRLDHCQMLLKNTDMPVSQIAQQVFSDTPNYFYATFKRRFGISPAKYRKELRARGE